MNRLQQESGDAFGGQDLRLCRVLKLSSNSVVTPIDKHGRTPLDYILCVVKAFKRTKKWSGYNRRIILLKKPPRSVTYTGKMEQGWTSLSDKVLVVVR